MSQTRRASPWIVASCALAIAGAACGNSQASMNPTSTVVRPTPTVAVVTPTPMPTIPTRDAVSIVGTDPFAGCNYSGSGTLIRGVTYEPSAAIGGPPGHRLMVALYYQGYIQRPGMNGGLGFVLAASTDHGSTWTNHPIPLGHCVHNLAGDAVTNGRVAVGPDGTTYVAAMAGDYVSPIRLALTASPDAGLSWSPPSFKSMKGVYCHADEPSVTADPARPGHAYAVWVDACWPSHAAVGISTTSDGGKTWTEPRDIPMAGFNWVNWPTIVPDPASDAIHLFFSDCQNTVGPSYTLVMASSFDQGASWGSPVTVAQGSGQFGPDPSVAAANGSLYVTWDTDQGLLMAKSTNAGQSWSSPQTVATTNQRASLAVNSSDTLAIAFPPNTMVVSADQGRTFSAPEQFSALGVRTGFAGDYPIALLADGPDFHAVFACEAGNTTSTCFW